MINNLDKPGIIGAVGTLLGENKINIAAMNFGREEAGGKALRIINVDSPVSKDILQQMGQIKNILSVKLIKV